MVRQYVVMVSLVLGWMLSPDVLVRLGNGIADNRTLFLAMLAASALLTALASAVIHNPLLQKDTNCDLVELLLRGIGRLPAMTLILTGRTLLILLLPTGLLVSAGYAFNEIFVYWFPNFGFSFILLGLVTIVNLLGDRFARNVQPFLIAPAVVGLVILCLAGLSGPSEQGPLSVDTGFVFSGAGLMGCFLLFLGIDYHTPHSYQESRLPGFAGLFLALLLFVIWSMVSLQYVAPEKLGGSTIPHIVAAREILGQPGRVLMGIMIICSCTALVNMLFLQTKKSFAVLAEKNLLPGHSSGAFPGRIYTLLFAVLIGLLMINGLAGDKKLETFIQAALLLWLFLTGCFCIAAGRNIYHFHNYSPTGSYAIGSVLIIIALILVAIDSNRDTILALLGVTLSLTGCLSLYWLKKDPVVEIVPTKHKNSGGYK